MLKKRQQVLGLVLAVYRVSRLFPEGEVLIGQLRKTANKIFKDLILGQKKKMAQQIKVLLGYLEIAQAQNWIKPINFVILIREYHKLLGEIEQVKKVGPIKIAQAKRLSQRQKAILKRAETLRKFRLGELNKYFSGISSRTLQRDLEDLSTKKYLTKKGHGRGAFYRITTE